MLTILDKPIKHFVDDLRLDIERVQELAEDGYMEEIAPTVIEKLNDIITLITNECGQKIGADVEASQEITRTATKD